MTPFEHECDRHPTARSASILLLVIGQTFSLKFVQQWWGRDMALGMLDDSRQTRSDLVVCAKSYGQSDLGIADLQCSKRERCVPALIGWWTEMPGWQELVLVPSLPVVDAACFMAARACLDLMRREPKCWMDPERS